MCYSCIINCRMLTWLVGMKHFDNHQTFVDSCSALAECKMVPLGNCLVCWQNHLTLSLMECTVKRAVVVRGAAGSH